MTRSIAAFVAFVLAAVVAQPLARAAPVDVYLLAGQSNAGGHGYVSKASAYYSAFKDPGLVEIDETRWLAVQPLARLYAQGGTVPSKAHPHFWERRTDGWVAMRAGTDTVDRAGAKMRHTPFGVEVTFAARVVELRPGARVAVVKYTRGATSVRVDWDPTAGRAFALDRPAAAGHCYAGFVRATEAALADLRRAGDEPTIRGLMWVQGESDAGMKPPEYAERLRALVSALREDFKTPGLPVAVGELLQINPQFAALREAQRAFVAADPHAVLVTSEGLTADHTYGGKLHIDTASILRFGTRFADAMAPLLKR